MDLKRHSRLAALLAVCILLISSCAAADLMIPRDTTVIEAQAFYGDTSLTAAELPEGLLSIGKQAFAYSSLSSVLLPYSLEYFAPDAFDGCPDTLEIRVYDASEAQQLCERYGIPYIIEQEPSFFDIGVFMPTNSLQRWASDGAYLNETLVNAGYGVFTQYADNQPDLQAEQIEYAIDGGCRLLIIAPIDPYSLGPVLDKALEYGIPVIAYDRLLMDTDAVSYYVTFDSYRVGTLQGLYVEDMLNLKNAPGPFYAEFTAGDPGDRNAALFFQGAKDVLQPYIDNGSLIIRSGRTDFADAATNYWSSDEAQQNAEDILTAYYAGGKRIDAWICSNDSTASGVIPALENCYNGTGWPVVTGQDCEIANVRYIIDGKQSMSVIKETQKLAQQTVRMAIQILNGEKVDVNDTSYHNGVKNVPAFLCDPTIVDRNNYRQVLIDTGYYPEGIFD